MPTLNDAHLATGPRLITALGILVIAHCGLGLARIPHAVVAKRWKEVAACEREGEVAFVFRAAHLHGANAIETLRATTPGDAIIAVRGEGKGALEFAPALLWPRLCKAVDALPAGATSLDGRPIAPLVLVAEGKELRLEPR